MWYAMSFYTGPLYNGTYYMIIILYEVHIRISSPGK